jgi:2-polyprenyl-3-methyl-5-hydroxy-6-metoxy-1,4-benzoquinol methylase
MAEKERGGVAIAGNYQYKALNEGYRMQRFWHRTKFLAIRKFLPPESGDFILDVGYGSGVISSFLGKFGTNVVGIDANPEAIRFATTCFASERVLFIESQVDNIMPIDR